MTDRLLTSADQKAALSVVYAKAVAARACFAALGLLAQPERSG